jgi:hypothetical protein
MNTSLPLLTLALTLVTACGDSSAAGGAGGAAPVGGSGTGNASSAGGSGNGGEAPGECVPPVAPPAHGPPASCLTGTMCDDDSDCPGNTGCNLETLPTQCQDVACGDEGSVCSDDMFCPDGLTCSNGVCTNCNLCGSGQCEVDFMNDPQHCGCCNNPALPPATCVGGVPACPSGQASCESIFPMAAGYAWTFEVTEGSAACSAGTHVSEVVMVVEDDIIEATSYQLSSPCGGEGGFFYAAVGDSILINRGEWLTLFGEPIEEGGSWMDGEAVRTWQEEGTVTVQAGTFDDCWRVLYEDNDDRYTILCRGVGRVRDYAGGNYDIELVSKNF